MKKIEKEILEQLKPKTYRLVSVYNHGDEEWKDYDNLDEALEEMAIADQYITDLERKQGNKVYVGLVEPDSDDFIETWNMTDKFSLETMKIVGRNLERARKMADMTQSELAEKTGTTQLQINEYEIGNQDMTLTRMRLIELALDADPGTLTRGL